MHRAAFLLPLIAFAQAPPPDTDQALRSRVSEFFQAHVDGKFTKSFELVAEDTRDYYFNTQKNKLQTYKIDSIDYTDDFTKAEVLLTCQRMMKMSSQFPEIQVTVPMKTTWKIENGKWFYYHDPKNDRILPMSTTTVGQAQSASVAATPPPNLSEAAIAARARAILQQSKVDKSQITLAADKPSSDTVVFHNGAEGWVQVAVDPGQRKIKGFKAELDKINVGAGEDAVLKLSYAPEGDERPGPVTLQLIVQPLNQAFPISVNFAQ